MVYGLQARAYLERGTSDNDSEAYKKAAEYARKAITTSGCTPLTQAQWEDPTTGFNSATANNSWIWGLPITSDNVTNLMNFQAHIGNEESWGYGHQVGRAIDKEFYTKSTTRISASTRGSIPTATSTRTRVAAPTAVHISLR